MLEPNKNAPQTNGLKRSETKTKKREKYIPNSEPLALPFCRICGKRASGIHFGVYSCEACKVSHKKNPTLHYISLGRCICRLIFVICLFNHVHTVYINYNCTHCRERPACMQSFIHLLTMEQDGQPICQ